VLSPGSPRADASPMGAIFRAVNMYAHASSPELTAYTPATQRHSDAPGEPCRRALVPQKSVRAFEPAGEAPG
jgi:hypothetical protein